MLLERCAARELHGAGGLYVNRDAEASRPTRPSRAALADGDVVRPELGAGDLEDQRRRPGPPRRAQWISAAESAGEDHARSARVVEAFEKQMFLKPTAKDPRLTALARVVLPAPQAVGSGRAGAPRARAAPVGCPPDHAAQERSADYLPLGNVSPGASAFRGRSSTGSIPSAAARLSICGSGREAGLDGAEPAHRPAGRVVRVDARRLVSALVTSYGPTQKSGFEVTARREEA